jgi:hypothetical protein
VTSPPCRAPVERSAPSGDVTEGAPTLDAVQQRLFAVALGLRDLRSRIGDGGLVADLERLEEDIDALIRDVRARAIGISRDG